jgi:predicted transposase YbfD/YdcC
VEGEGDFVLAVKDNQRKLRQAIERHFTEHLAKDFEELQYRHHESEEEGHGRFDERAYFLTRVPKDFAVKAEWPWVKAIGYAVRFTQHADGRLSHEVRYYIVSRYLSGKRFGEAVRGHWGIEAMHWVLDVNFREVDSRTRVRTLGNNLSWLRRFAITRLKQHPMKESIRGKMQIAGWNPDFLAEVLMGKEV